MNIPSDSPYINRRASPLPQLASSYQNQPTIHFRTKSTDHNKHIQNTSKNKHSEHLLIKRQSSHDNKNGQQQSQRSVSKCQDTTRKNNFINRSKNKQNKLSLSTLEIENLKYDMMSMKNYYQNILEEKSRELSEFKNQSSRFINKLQMELQNQKKVVQKYKILLQGNQHEIERIKGECIKILEIEAFKNKKLQETLEQKQLMIRYLRTEFNKENSSEDICYNSNKRKDQENHFKEIFLQSSTPIFGEEFKNQVKIKNHKDKNYQSEQLISMDKEKNRVLYNKNDCSEDEILTPIIRSKAKGIFYEGVLNQQGKNIVINQKKKSHNTFSQEQSFQPNCHTFEVKQAIEYKIKHKYQKQVEMDRSLQEINKDQWQKNNLKKNQKTIRQKNRTKNHIIQPGKDQSMIKSIQKKKRTKRQVKIPNEICIKYKKQKLR